MNARCLSILKLYSVTKAQGDFCKQVFCAAESRVKASGILRTMGALDKLRLNTPYANATTDFVEAPEAVKVR